VLLESGEEVKDDALGDELELLVVIPKIGLGLEESETKKEGILA